MFKPIKMFTHLKQQQNKHNFALWLLYINLNEHEPQE